MHLIHWDVECFPTWFCATATRLMQKLSRGKQHRSNQLSANMPLLKLWSQTGFFMQFLMLYITTTDRNRIHWSLKLVHVFVFMLDIKNVLSYQTQLFKHKKICKCNFMPNYWIKQCKNADSVTDWIVHICSCSIAFILICAPETHLLSAFKEPLYS